MGMVVSNENRRAAIGKEFTNANKDFAYASVSSSMEAGIAAALACGDLVAYEAGMEAFANLQAQF
jgi:hypothetical protein